MPREDLISRVPQIWRTLDKDATLEHFLSVLDGGFNGVWYLIEELKKIRSSDQISDRDDVRNASG